MIWPFKRKDRWGKCPTCAAGSNQICVWNCPQRTAGTRPQNAPLCKDGLHHHCARQPHCLSECIDELKE